MEELKSSIFERIYEIEQGYRFEIHIAPNVDARIILYAYPRLSLCCILMLRSVLGPNFPIDPPSVTVSPPCAHPWISGPDYRVTGNKKLNDWNQHVNLSKRLKEIVSEFRERPPSLLRVAPPPIPSTPSRYASWSMFAVADANPAQAIERLDIGRPARRAEPAAPAVGRPRGDARFRLWDARGASGPCRHCR